MLQLQIGFPSGRYFAADIADPRAPEWPPHPSRVYSALVAAAYAGGKQPSSDERSLLDRIAAAPPPALSFPDADLRAGADSYVPVNDSRSRIDSKRGQSKGVLFPNHQVRQFPAAFMLGEPEVRLSWELDVAPDELRVLDGIAARVTHVGTSHALVTARFTRDASFVARLAPGVHGGQYLRVPMHGRLDELDLLAAQGHGTVRRPPPACEALVPYAHDGLRAEAQPTSRYDWVCLRMRDATWGADTSHTLARGLRRAVLSLLADAAPAAVHGHDAQIEHVAWLPLPDVGHPHARGKVRGIAVALPLSMPAEERAIALAGLARLAVVVLPDGQVAQMNPVIDGTDLPLALRSATWLGPSTHWSTVTPILLDRPPKRQNEDQILAALVASIVGAGYPEPVEARAMRASDFEGAPGALEVPTRVPRFHARLVFAQPLLGPVIAGRWRNFGIGLLRPSPTELRK